MRITDVAVERVRPKRTVGQRSTVKHVTHSTCLLVTLTADDGTQGLGEIPDIEEPEALPPDDRIAAQLEAAVRGADPRRITALARELPETLPFGADEFHSVQQLAVGALDMALYDLVGRRYDVPAVQLLGGPTQDAPVCWVCFTKQDDDELAALEDEVATRYDEGFRSFKLKVGEVDPAVDEARIRAVRDIVGEEANVFIDAQGVWSLEEAIERLERFAPIGIDGVETPVGHPDRSVTAPGYYYDIPLLPEELATLRTAVDVPVMEHVLDPAFGLALAEHDAVDVVTAEVCAGGITRAREVLSVAEAAGFDARLGSTVELGPGTLAGVALAASSPAVTVASDLIGPLAYVDRYIDDPVTYHEGTLRPRDRPGLGIQQT